MKLEVLPSRKTFDVKNSPYNQEMKKFFNPRQRKFTIFSTPLKKVFKDFRPPLTSRPPPHCLVKNDQPLRLIKSLLFDIFLESCNFILIESLKSDYMQACRTSIWIMLK